MPTDQVSTPPVMEFNVQTLFVADAAAGVEAQAAILKLRPCLPWRQHVLQQQIGPKSPCLTKLPAANSTSGSHQLSPCLTHQQQEWDPSSGCLNIRLHCTVFGLPSMPEGQTL